MNASLETPDGAPAVEEQGGAADPLDRAARVAPQAEARCANAAWGATLRQADPDVGVGDADRARAPDLRVPPAQRDLQGDHVLEQAFGALAQLAAARRVAGERVGARDAGPGWRQLGMKPAKDRRDVLHPPLGQAAQLLRAARPEPGNVPARDLFEPRGAYRLAHLGQAVWRLDAVCDSRRRAEGRRVRVQQLEIGVLAVQVQAGIGRVLADGRPLLQRSEALQEVPAFRHLEGRPVGRDVEVVEQHVAHDLIFSTNGVFATFAGTALPRISTSNVEPSFASAAGT